MRVLDDLGRLRDHDARCAEHARRDDAFINRGDPLERVRIVAGNHFQDLGKRVLPVARIDALRRITDVKIALPLLAREFLEDRNADFLGGAGIDGRFVNDDGAVLHMLADRFTRANQRPEIGLVHLIHRGRHGDDNEIRFSERRGIGGYAKLRGRAQVRTRQLAGRIDEPAIVFDLGARHVEADGFAFLAKLDGKRQAHIAKANNCDYAHEFILELISMGGGAPRPASPGAGNRVNNVSRVGRQTVPPRGLQAGSHIQWPRARAKGG